MSALKYGVAGKPDHRLVPEWLPGFSRRRSPRQHGGSVENDSLKPIVSANI